MKRYRMYSIFGPTTYTQDRITIWDRIAKLFGWLDWVELVDDTSAERIETKLNFQTNDCTRFNRET